MKHKDLHKNLDPYSNLKPPYSRSKEDVWAELSKQIEEKPEEELDQTKVFSLNPVLRYAIAASIAILIAVPLFMRFYTKTVYAPIGERASLVLPDNSKVNLNSDTKVAYAPLWWRFNRNVKMEGEAYFEVSKGKSFTVSSTNGETTVLGTSFNIYARNANYDVTCLTGVVKVSDYSQSVIIKPNQQASLNKSEGLLVENTSDSENAISWINNKFFYTATSLSRVISDIELQYNISIQLDENISNANFKYTGNFSRDISPEKVLYFVCEPLGLKSVKYGPDAYEIIQAK